MLSLLLRSLEFGFYHCLITAVDKVSRLPRNSTIPEAARLYRENIALKAQLDVLELRLKRDEASGDNSIRKPRRKRPLKERAAQVFAYMLTRGDEPFQRYFLSASIPTIRRWASIFRKRKYVPPNTGGRPTLDPRIEELIVTLKRENGAWGQKRISEELRRMGIRVHARTVQRVLKDHGFSPHPGHGKLDFERYQSAAKDAVWALDYFAVKTAKDVWVQVLMVLDIHTRERLELRVYDGWDVDSRWTSKVFARVLARTGRKPAKVIHDHGSHFAGQFERQLRVLDIEQDRTLPGLPSLNCYVETSIGTCRRELLRHIRVSDAGELQRYLDDYLIYVNEERAHQGLDGRSPGEVSRHIPEAPVVNDLSQLRLVRREYANGILHGYSLDTGPPETAPPLAA
ncbi:MAG: transposase [Polyangiaceae bacterium]|nr:transposase [Polyangiaceae bacterium]